MDISDCMKHRVFSVTPETTVGEAATEFVKRHIGTLPVVSPEKELLGILQIRDILTLVMPDFIHMIKAFDYVSDFGAAENRLPDADTLSTPVSEIMQPPISVEQDSGLLRAAALFKEYSLSDLPVVDNQGKLVGIASLVDIGTAFLRGWNLPIEEIK